MLLFEESVMKAQKLNIVQLGNVIIAQIIYGRKEKCDCHFENCTIIQDTSTVLIHKVS